MAVFTRDPEELSRLDWWIPQNGAVSLYFRSQVLAEDVAWFREQGYRVHAFDCTGWLSGDLFHNAVCRVLDLPDWYGPNLDAFNDSLSDLAVPDAGGVVLQFTRFDVFAANLPRVARDVLDIIETNSRHHLLFGGRLIALAQSNDPSISLGPVGARPVSWNPREWLAKQRGL
jgi:RNAse (barnase) inhibitor barstar